MKLFIYTIDRWGKERLWIQYILAFWLKRILAMQQYLKGINYYKASQDHNE